MPLRGKGFREPPARPMGENLRSKESGQRERIQTPRSRTGEGLARISARTLWRQGRPLERSYGLIAAIHYNRRRVYIRAVLAHQEYDEGKWKE